jgi:ectoine hydroxylase-related dioxygenase (phytanoyl-CoA dioxygenase family)
MTNDIAAMKDLRSFVDAVGTRGWASTAPLFSDRTVLGLRAAVAPLAMDGRGGARNLLACDELQDLARSAPLRELACAILGRECFAVRGLFFDKTPQTNWKVVWHQDLTIATRARAECAGYGPWTEKGGIPHVQPAVRILENMIALRVHLDACTATNGPVRVIDGSHRFGRLSPEAIDEMRQRERAQDCLVAQGGVLAFRPLLLHASAPAQQPGHRRVIHIEYAGESLAAPLEWHDRVA